MKYVVLVPDGMADRPIGSLGNRTPMEAAVKPAMDELAKHSRVGTVSNVPDGMVPESDTANLAIMSYDPRTYSKGRSPLEAMSLGLTMEPDDTAIRCNVVTLSGTADEPYASRTMLDHSADEITTEEAAELVKALNEALPMPGRELHTGISYRHCLIWKDADDHYAFDRPHDIIGQVIGSHLPKAENGGAEFLRYMEEGAKVLDHHPINEARRAKGLHPANSPWLWSPGRKPALPSFRDKWGVSAAVVCAVDLIKGIGICAGCDVPTVIGATGNFSTNWSGKAEAAIEALKTHDFVYIHVEAPDECGHQGKADEKTASVEKIDSLILAPVLDALRKSGEPFRILVLPDHPTPIEIRTHSIEPVPFLLYDSEKDEAGVDSFTEAKAAGTGWYLPDGSHLLDEMFRA